MRTTTCNTLHSHHTSTPPLPRKTPRAWSQRDPTTRHGLPRGRRGSPCLWHTTQPPTPRPPRLHALATSPRRAPRRGPRATPTSQPPRWDTRTSLPQRRRCHQPSTDDAPCPPSVKTEPCAAAIFGRPPQPNKRRSRWTSTHQRLLCGDAATPILAQLVRFPSHPTKHLRRRECPPCSHVLPLRGHHRGQWQPLSQHQALDTRKRTAPLAPSAERVLRRATSRSATAM